MTSSPPHHHHHQDVTPSHLLPPLLGATLTFSLLIFICAFFRRFLHRLKPQPPSSTTFPRRFSFSTLRRATSSFSPSHRLGQGGFGSVFSATISVSRRHKLPVAVKLLDCGSLQGEREFQNELLIANKLLSSDRVVKLLGFSTSRKRRRMCLVYELMVNGNLQDCLLHKKSEELMEWCQRFRVAIEVAQGLAFLHHSCNPPIIHGDVKPSNVLLDHCFAAKIADFGLARLKFGDFIDVSNNQGIKVDNNINNNDNNVDDVVNVRIDDDSDNNVVVDVGVEDTGSVIETESVATTVGGFEEVSVGVDQSPMRAETSPEMVTAKTSPSEFCDRGIDLEGQFQRSDLEEEEEVGKVVEKTRGSKNVNVNGGGSSGKVKEYVMEWMGMDVGREGVSGGDWNKGGASTSSVVPKKGGKTKRKKMEWWTSMEEGWIPKKEKRRPVREWWKEDYSEELARKKKKKKKKKKKNLEAKSDDEENWWPRDTEMYVDKHKKKISRSRKSSRSSVDWWLDGFSGDLWKIRHTSYDSMSGEIPKSGGISSTPSMRGTVCYIAPEYSSGGDLSEKCDVYSFGVLLLVLVAGRRPLQVTGSPFSEFHKANLVSWARQLARSGKLLDLVDTKIRSVNREEAQLCIIVALLCLQKSPVRRPSMKEVVGMLIGELAPPQLPMEYSKSPASHYPYKSRKKNFR